MYPNTRAGLEREPAKPLPKEFSTTPIIGYRVWTVKEVGGLLKLKSIVKPVYWPYRKPLEQDTFMDEGIHAVKTGERLQRTWNEYGSATVAGEVYLWGKVIECEAGYLAQYAYPKKLMVPDDFDPIRAMMLEDEYGVPVEFRSELMRNQQLPGDEFYGLSFYGGSRSSGQTASAALIAAQQIAAFQQMQMDKLKAQQRALAVPGELKKMYPDKGSAVYTGEKKDKSS